MSNEVSPRSGSRVSGLVIGTRKAGTTWVYQNLAMDPSFNVSRVVKESEYFSGTGRYSRLAYEALFESSDAEGQVRVEVDSSICYSDAAEQLIAEYNPSMRLVLTLRRPAEFLQSRYVHAKRKGETRARNPREAIERHEWLRAELDYPRILARFGVAASSGRLLVLPFDDLRRDPISYYMAVTSFLAGGARLRDFQPDTQAINVARTSSNNTVSGLLSQAAIVARRFRCHWLVNSAKGLGLHRRIETPVRVHERVSGVGDLEEVVREYFPGSVQAYDSLAL